MKSCFHKISGFTLIEVLIAAAIIAILAAIAYPSYQDSVRKSRRADAIAALTDLQLQQEKWRANNTTYAGVSTSTPPAAPNGLVLPTSSYYTFGISNNTATTYTLTATAVSGKGQDKDKQEGTTCTPLTINQNNDKGTTAACWRK